MAGIVVALASAVTWGGADFAGGRASQRRHWLEVLALSRLSGFALLVVLSTIGRVPLPGPSTVAWAAAAGLSGMVGLGALYKGLSVGPSVQVAPAAAMVGAAIPALFAIVVHGALPITQQAGLALVLVAVYLPSRGRDGSETTSRRGVQLGAVSGIGFGGFFILLGQIQSQTVLSPLAVAMGAASLVAVIAMRVAQPVPSARIDTPEAIIAGVLDATGTVLYVLAIRWIRLDIAAVLGSLHPAVTVVLFRGIAGEPV